MQAIIKFTEKENGNYSVQMHLPKNFNATMIKQGLTEQIEALNNEFFRFDIDENGFIKHSIDVALEIKNATN